MCLINAFEPEQLIKIFCWISGWRWPSNWLETTEVESVVMQHRMLWIHLIFFANWNIQNQLASDLPKHGDKKRKEAICDCRNCDWQLCSISFTRYQLVRFIITLFPMKEHLSVHEFNIYIPNCKCNMYNIYILSETASVYINTH